MNEYSIDPESGAQPQALYNRMLRNVESQYGRPKPWDATTIAAILEVIQNRILRIPKEELSVEAEIRQATGATGVETSDALSEVNRKAKGRRDEINASDIEQLLGEVIAEFTVTYERQTGTPASQGDIDIAQGLISKYFVVDNDPIYHSNVPYRWSDMVTMPDSELPNDWYPIIRAFESVKISRETQVDTQPLYFTKDLEFEAYLNAAQRTGLLDPEDRADDRAMRRIEREWETIKNTLLLEGAFTSAALQTKMEGVLRKAQGVNASKESYLNLNFLTTHFTENPRTQDDQRKILMAQDRLSDLTMDDYNDISKDPAKWFESKFADQNIIDEYADPEEKVAQEELKRQIRSEALQFQDQFRQWESGTTEEGFLQYQPSEVLLLANDAFKTSHETLAPTINQLNRDAKIEREAEEGVEASEQAREDRYKLFNTYTKLETAVKSAVMVDNNGKLPSTEVLSYLIAHFASVVDSSIQYKTNIPDVRQWVSENHGSYLPQLINENLLTQFTEDPKMLGDKKVFGGMSIRDRVGLGERPKEQGGGEWGATNTWSNAFISALQNNPGWIQSEQGREDAASLVDQSLYGQGITPSGEYAPFSGEVNIGGQRYGAQGAEFLDQLFEYMPQQVQNMTSWASQNPMASPFSIPAELTADGTEIRWMRSGDKTPMKEVWRDGERVQEIDYSQMRGYEIPSNFMPGSAVNPKTITNYDPKTGSYDYVQPSPVIRPGSAGWNKMFGAKELPVEATNTLPPIKQSAYDINIDQGGLVTRRYDKTPVNMRIEIPYDPILQEEDQSIFGYRGV